MPEPMTWVFLILLDDQDDADDARQRLDDAWSPHEDDVGGLFKVPPPHLRGDAYFSADPRVQREVADWWDEEVGVDDRQGRVVYVHLVDHSPDLPDYIPYHPGLFWIRIPDTMSEEEEEATYGHLDTAYPRWESDDVVGDLIAAYLNSPDRTPVQRLFLAEDHDGDVVEPPLGPPGAGIATSQDPWRPVRQSAEMAEQEQEQAASRSRPPAADHRAVPPQPAMASATAPTRGLRDAPDPFTHLAREETIGEVAAPAGWTDGGDAGRSGGDAVLPPRTLRDRVVGLVDQIRRRTPVDLDLGRYAEYLGHPDYHGMVVVVMGPKGGGGKTTTSIGLALSFNQMLDEAHSNGRVCLLDGNIKNADIAWRSMPVRNGVPTVRDITMKVRTDPTAIPDFQFANARARHMVVIREQEGGDGYQHAEIKELAAALRNWFSVIVVDLVDEYPGLGNPAQRLVQSWLAMADVVVVPAKAWVPDLEVATRVLHEVAGTPAIATYIQPAHDDLDQHPEVQRHLRRIHETPGVQGIYCIPETPLARLAALNNVNITDASPALRVAFADLAKGCVAVHVEAAARRARPSDGGRPDRAPAADLFP